MKPRVFWTTYGLLLLGAVLVGGLSGMLLGYSLDLPEVQQLQEIRPNVVSYVYSDDGKVLGEFALEKRMLVTYDQIPETLKHAILAAEDSNFFNHSGIDFRRFFIAVLRNIFLGERKGASTLTMQLCKLRFTSSEKSIERKIKDMLFALETEKNYSKEQIFTLYFNQIYMGHGIYGLAAAADFYFDKTLDELNLSESALLAGILNVPERYSPLRSPDRALRRRTYTLRRMVEEGYITEDELESAQSEALSVTGRTEEETAAYFVEWVRQHLEKNYSTETIWKGGLKVHTTLDFQMQQAAVQALRKGLRQYDKRNRPWEGATSNVLENGNDLESYRHPDWKKQIEPGSLIHGLAVDVNPEKAEIRFGRYSAVLTVKGIDWTGLKRVDRALKRGDVNLFSVVSVSPESSTLEVTLDRVPEVQGAVMVLDNRTGAIRAMVGGFDFSYSKFNRATQAVRQPGSIFKPFTYVAAVEAGKLPSDLLLDAPFYAVDELGRPYEPKNYDGSFKGLIPLEQALAESRNVPTIRLAQALGIRTVISVAQRFGVQREFLPVLPIALGAGEITLEEVTSAFSVFGNRGVRALPYYVRRVENYEGEVLEEHEPNFSQVLEPDVNSKMLYLLRQVITRGTGARALALNRPLVGKTGTTNDSTDVWFVGVTPLVTAGVWIGFDEKKSLGEKVTGTSLALPIWLEMMQAVADRIPPQDFEDFQPEPSFEAAQGLVRQSTAESQTAISVEEIPPPGKTEDPPAEPPKPSPKPPSD